jgi:hypothetical protein
MNAVDWLRVHAPGMSQLTADDRAATYDVSIFWSLFESRALSNSASAELIMQITKN